MNTQLSNNEMFALRTYLFLQRFMAQNRIRKPQDAIRGYAQGEFARIQRRNPRYIDGGEEPDNRSINEILRDVAVMYNNAIDLLEQYELVKQPLFRTPEPKSNKKKNVQPGFTIEEIYRQFGGKCQFITIPERDGERAYIIVKRL